MTEKNLWPRSSPVSLLEQIRLFLHRTVPWRVRRSLPLPPHLQAFVDQYPSAFHPFTHFSPL